MRRQLLIIAILYSTIGISQNLQRPVFHGFQPAPLTEDLRNKLMLGSAVDGVYIANVVPGGTAAAADMATNDVLLAINDINVSSPQDFGSAWFSDLQSGEEIVYTVMRGSEKLTLTADGIERPKESGDSPVTEYFEIPFDGGHLRAIANRPEGDGPFPTIFFIQGYTCSSIESTWPGHPYRLLAKAFTEAGIAFVRVEKPGVGDSEGMTDCMDSDFLYEARSFTEAAQFVREMDWVNTDSLFIFGHSMGGYLAPVVAKEVPTTGIIAYGTRHEPWREYFLQMWRFQLVRQGFSYREVESRMAEYYELGYHLFYERMSPIQISEQYPNLIDEMQDGLAWGGDDVILFRNYEALQSVDDLPVVPSWLDYEGKVLMFYGTADFEVCSDDSPKEIVRMINTEGAGEAVYEEVEGADHSMFMAGSMEEGVSMDRDQRREMMMQGIDPQVYETVINWIIK